MNNQTFSEYLNVQQVRDLFNLDLPQLKHAISKYELRLWAYIGNKKRDFDKQPISVIELNYVGMPSIEEINRLDKLSVQEIEIEGWSITHLPHPHNFIAHKGKLCFMVTHENGTKGFRLPIIDDGNAIEHDGFVEIDYEESPFDRNKNLAVLFNESELYLCQAKSNKSGHMCLLKPGCYITLNDLYIHRDEIKRFEQLINDTKVNVLPSFNEVNRLSRTGQIAALYNQICLEHPVRIDLSKIKQPIHIINLAWILAFCRMGYDSYGSIKYESKALCSMAEDLRKIILDKLQDSGELANLNAKYYDEVDLATGYTISKVLSFKLTPEVAVAVIRDDPIFCKYAAKEILTEQHTKNDQYENIIQASPPMLNIISNPDLATHPNTTNNTSPPNPLLFTDERVIKQKTQTATAAQERPSEKGTSKSEIIRLELELTLSETQLAVINRTTLWEALLNRARTNQNSKLKTEKNKLIEKGTNTVWDRERTNYHLDEVINWHEAQITSRTKS